MESLMQQLVEAVEKQNSAFPWDTVIAGIALAASLITLFLLFRERCEKNRPYLQISFELVRSTLACIVLRNTGITPLEITSLQMNSAFIDQLPEEVRNKIKKKEKTSIVIFPNRMWVFSFDVNVFEVLQFQNTELTINYSYTQLNRRKSYNEKVTIDFEEYKGLLVYISDLDEFKRSVDSLKYSLNEVTKAITALDKDPLSRLLGAHRGDFENEERTTSL